MEKREEFRRYLRALRREFGPKLERHLSEDELIDYQQGRLEGQERQKVQSHLVHCHECVEICKGVVAFFESPEEGSEPIHEKATDRKWDAWLHRGHGREQVLSREPELESTGFWRSSGVTVALAASLIAAIVGTSLWLFRLRQENRRLVEQARLQEKTWVQHLNEVQQENRRLQEKASALQQSSESQLAQLRQPSVNAAIYDVLPQESVPRSGTGKNANVVRVPATTGNLVLILHRDDNRKYPAYRMEILDRNSQLRWSRAGLEPASDGSFIIALNRMFLGQGEYRLKLYGKRGPSSKEVAEYRIVIQ